jgi:stage III sporulation protein AG
LQRSGEKMKELWNRFMALFPGKDGTQAARLVLVGLSLGLLVLWGGDLFNLVFPFARGSGPSSGTAAQSQGPSTDAKLSDLRQREAALEAELDAKLSRIAGAGKVRSSVSLLSGPKLEITADLSTERTETTETDPAGGKRTQVTTSERTQHVLQQGTGNNAPVVTQEFRPSIAGVLVVADGASNAIVRQKLHQAVYTMLGIPPNRVTVMPAGGGHG